MEWENRFDEKFNINTAFAFEEIKDFIKSLLADERKKVLEEVKEKIEKLELENKFSKEQIDNDEMGYIEKYTSGERSGWDKAIWHIYQSLQNKEEA